MFWEAPVHEENSHSQQKLRIITGLFAFENCKGSAAAPPGLSPQWDFGRPTAHPPLFSPWAAGPASQPPTASSADWSWCQSASSAPAAQAHTQTGRSWNTDTVFIYNGLPVSPNDFIILFDAVSLGTVSVFEHLRVKRQTWPKHTVEKICYFS